MSGRDRLLVAIATFIVFAVAPGTAEPVSAAPSVQGVRCLSEARIDLLDGLFDSEPAGVVGADYQRATALGDGRVLWTFQDAAVRLGPDEITIVHNIAALQDGGCFSILYGGSRFDPEPFFFGDITQPYQRWYWPLGAETANDGKVYVFVAELEERGDDYLSHAVPVATHVVALDGQTLLPVGRSPAPNSSAALYGWSVTTDRDWTYLYAQCHRQFGFEDVNGIPAHDDCAARVTVGRVPRGQLLATPQYWDGSTWQGDPARAVSVVPTAGRIAHATQIVWTGASFVSIDKLDDWWGDTVVFGRSASPTGPFVEFDRVAEPLKCDELECNSFFATWVPWDAAGRPARTLGWTISHNRWDGEITAGYRPTFHTVAAPQFVPEGGIVAIDVPDREGVPVLNVTAVVPSRAGHLTVFPCDRAVPTASNVNHRAGETVANLAMVRPDADGRVCIRSHSDGDLVVDHTAQLPDGFTPVDNPRRLVDTRSGVGGVAGRVAAGGVFVVEMPDGVGVPVLNVTAVVPSGAGHLTVFPCDRAVPTASNVNYGAGETVANLAMVRPDATGRVCVQSFAETDLVVDLAGRATTYEPVDNPVRLVDTRSGVGGVAGRVAAGGVFVVEVPDGVGVPVLNVTAVVPSGAGHLTVFPCDRAVPTASNVNYGAGETVANLAMVRPDATGRVCVYTAAEADLVVDHTGTWTDGIEPVDNPVRLADTRLLP
ncbi:hypothetical protein BDK89_2258 [Ilumatobacter fluminis]|uniref:DUF4185 domain-containing protein n=1 Tax=Ilumatobacter fluminis TaxID=467091 RepID=A0A4R7HZV7_9ACTN|nr:hypothetical protein [Ilumatobacter fluminis]TDT16665.1 hypothetical protein BDK89_2258 [Ilumatobacter fluminis]